jgi:hypothetical protein
MPQFGACKNLTSKAENTFAMYVKAFLQSKAKCV